MTDRGEAPRRPSRAPVPARTRRRWAAAAGVAACWALLVTVTGSLVAGTALLVFVVALAAGSTAGLRVMGVGAGHPWVQRMRSRPWRDGQEVLRLGLRHLPDVFVSTPGGSLLAPNAVELWLNPRDFGSLCEVMDVDLVNATAAEVYEEHVAAHGARFARPGPPRVWVTGEPSVPPGRYRLRQARPLEAVSAGLAQRPGAVAAPGPEPVAPGPAPGWPFAHDGRTRGGPVPSPATATGLPTVAEQGPRPVPPLRLVTDGRVAETTAPGARAGRGNVELLLPGVPTISREHARFTYTDGQWWITNLGRNGLALNGVPLADRLPVRDGDVIRWGTQAPAPVSRVEIG